MLKKTACPPSCVSPFIFIFHFHRSLFQPFSLDHSKQRNPFEVER